MYQLRERMRWWVFIKLNFFKIPQNSDRIIPTNIKALFVKITLKLDYAHMETNANSLMGLMSWDVMQRWTYHIRQNIAIHFWIRNVVFMDLDVTSSIKTISQLMNNKNGIKSTLTIVKLLRKANLKHKADYWPFWLNRLID